MHETAAELYGIDVNLPKDDREYSRYRDDPTNPYYRPFHNIIVEIVGAGEIHVTHDFPGTVLVEVHDYEQEEKTGRPTEFEPGVGRKAVRQARAAYGDFVSELDHANNVYAEEVHQRRL